MCSDQEIVAISKHVAKRMSRHSAHFEWRELWGAAWEGAIKGQTSVKDAFMGARREVSRFLNAYYRNEKPRKHAVLELETGEWNDLEPIAGGKDAEDRLIETWQDTSSQRKHIGLKNRLWLYLWTVEGFDQKEIAQLWNLTQGRVAQELAATRQAIRPAQAQTHRL